MTHRTLHLVPFVDMVIGADPKCYKHYLMNCSSFNLIYVIIPIKDSPRLLSFIDQSHSEQCIEKVNCGFSLVQHSQTTLVKENLENNHFTCYNKLQQIGYNRVK